MWHRFSMSGVVERLSMLIMALVLVFMACLMVTKITFASKLNVDVYDWCSIVGVWSLLITASAAFW